MARVRQRSKRKSKAPMRAAAGIGRLSAAEERSILDRAARRYLGMSGRDFLRKWHAGAFKNPDVDPAVRWVAFLAPVG